MTVDGVDVDVGTFSIEVCVAGAVNCADDIDGDGVGGLGVGGLGVGGVGVGDGVVMAIVVLVTGTGAVVPRCRE